MEFLYNSIGRFIAGEKKKNFNNVFKNPIPAACLVYSIGVIHILWFDVYSDDVFTSIILLLSHTQALVRINIIIIPKSDGQYY